MVLFWEKVFQSLLRKAVGLFRWQESWQGGGGKSGTDLLTNLELARREWIYANSYFNSVSDNDLIDHAIFYMGATEKKYIYLLKKAREKGICLDGQRLG